MVPLQSAGIHSKLNYTDNKMQHKSHFNVKWENWENPAVSWANYGRVYFWNQVLHCQMFVTANPRGLSPPNGTTLFTCQQDYSFFNKCLTTFHFNIITSLNA